MTLERMLATGLGSYPRRSAQVGFGSRRCARLVLSSLGAAVMVWTGGAQGVLAWGSNSQGQCAPIPGKSAVAVSAGSRHSLARLSDGTVAAWGDNSLGACNVPALPPGLS